MTTRDPKPENNQQKEVVEFSEPPSWDWSEVAAHLVGELAGRGIPLKRVRYQMEQDSRVLELKTSWAESQDWKAAWRELVQAGRRAIAEILPMCVQCGQCCRKGAPTLHLEDLELVQSDKIKPEELRTLREGEPVHSPFDGRVFYLPRERIKLKEKPGSSVCIFFEDAAEQCRIWEDRPVQCRAQSCWDSAPAKEVSERPTLTRHDILGNLEVLVELLDEHSQRCAHENLRKVFEDLKTSQGKNVDPVLEAIAFEDHFRSFVAERFNLPDDTLDFFFGRSFVGMLRLFGFKVEENPDGSRTLLPDTSQAGS